MSAWETDVGAPEFRDVDPLTDPAWKALDEADGGLFTSPAWLRAVAETYDLEAKARLALGDTEPVAGIAYCDVSGLLGHRRISFPFSDFHGPLGDAKAAAAVIESLLGELPTRFRFPGARLPPLDQRRFDDFERALVHHVIEVPDEDAVALFDGLASQVRQNIRRSRRSGVVVELSTDLGAVRRFYDLHVAVRTRKYRLLPQPFAFFESIHRQFSDDRLVVALARLEDQDVAGVLYLEHGDMLYYKFNASAADGLGVRPNEELLLAGMVHCRERNLRAIDLGVSDVDQPGLIRYKRKFTDIEQDVVTVTADGAAKPVGIGETLGELTRLLTDDRVPASVAEEAGALLYRNFA